MEAMSFLSATRFFRGLELSRYLQLLPAPLLRVMAALPGMLPQTKNPSWNDRIARWSKQATDSVQPPDRAFRRKLTPAGSPGVWSLLSSELQEQLAGPQSRTLSIECDSSTFDDRQAASCNSEDSSDQTPGEPAGVSLRRKARIRWLHACLWPVCSNAQYDHSSSDFSSAAASLAERP